MTMTSRKQPCCFAAINMRANFTSSRDISEEREIGLRREMDSLQIRLRDGDVGLDPEADVGRELGDALLHFAIPHLPLVDARGPRGLVDQPIPVEETRGELILWIGGDDTDGHLFPLELGALDPSSEISGAQARLMNLGFDGLAQTGTLDDATKDALAAFQEKHKLTVSRALDEATANKLRQLHEE